MKALKAVLRFFLANFMGGPKHEKPAYQEGYRAPFDAENPYPHGTWDYRHWQRGHEDAERSARAW